MRSLGIDITLDDVLAILDEHYNNVKALGCFESGALSATHGEKRDSIRLMCVPVETPAGSHSIIPRMFSSGPYSHVEA